jgi:hypothetical protein
MWPDNAEAKHKGRGTPTRLVAAWAVGAGLSPSFAGAAAAEVECVLLYLFARFRVEGDLRERYPAVVAGVGPLVLVVEILGRWVRGCARLLCGHEVPLRGPGPGRCELRGAIPVCGSVALFSHIF